MTYGVVATTCSFFIVNITSINKTACFEKWEFRFYIYLLLWYVAIYNYTYLHDTLFYMQCGNMSGLHIIILDEIDAICKARGSVAGSSAVHDTVVNQLLSKIDGVEELNNILVIGMIWIWYQYD